MPKGGQLGPIETTRLERRLKTRYPLVLDVRYRTLRSYDSVSGFGRSVNMSSSGILIASKHRFGSGTRLELKIAWPSRLDGVISLQLVAVGRVVRPHQSGFALELTKFRTLNRKPESISEEGSNVIQPRMIRRAGA